MQSVENRSSNSLWTAPGRFLNSNAASYGALTGTAAGIVGGIAYRTWHEIPADFKVLSRLEAIPFQIPVLNSINGVMQTMIKGPMKYAVPAMPLLIIGFKVAETTWRYRNTYDSDKARPIGLWKSFKFQMQELPKGEVVQATTLVALAVLMTVTQTHWLPAVTQLLPVGADPSGHAIMQIALGYSQALLIKAAKNAQTGTTQVSNACGLALGVGNAIMMFNTATTFHTVREIVSGSMLALSVVTASSYLRKGLPHLSLVTKVAMGTTMIATSLGYAPAALTTVVMTPLLVAGLTQVPGQLKELFQPLCLCSHAEGLILRGGMFTATMFTIGQAANALTPLVPSLGWIGNARTGLGVANIMFNAMYVKKPSIWLIAGSVSTLAIAFLPPSAATGALILGCAMATGE